jgi:TPP-dependent indolepyruvate ferredoxin oxidoreductase alpha subunit
MTARVSQIIAQALFDADALLTYVPATGGQDIHHHFCTLSAQQYPFSFHEEVAFTLAHGAALTGKRACAMMKAHGLAKAANSVVDALFAGTTAGLVILILEDPLGKHSDSILNSAPILTGMGVPFRHARKDGLREVILFAFSESERLGLPVAVIADSDEMDQEVPVTETVPPPLEKTYVRDITRHILCPSFGAYQYEILRTKRTGQNIDALLKPTVPTIPDDLPEKWKPAMSRYIPLFSVFREFRGDVVTADTGITCLFGCPPFDCVDLTTYMGGSVSLAIGALMAGHKPAWAVTGDFSFIAAGHLGLNEAIQRNLPVKVLLFDNGKAETTGGQIIPEGTLERTLAPYRDYIIRINNPGDPAEVRTALQAAAASATLTIVVADYKGK